MDVHKEAKNHPATIQIHEFFRICFLPSATRESQFYVSLRAIPHHFVAILMMFGRAIARLARAAVLGSQKSLENHSAW